MWPSERCQISALTSRWSKDTTSRRRSQTAGQRAAKDCGELCRGQEDRRMSNFRRLVLGCIDSYDSEQRRILQHFSRSTRCAFFSRLSSSKKCKFSTICFPKFLQNLTFFLLKNAVLLLYSSVTFPLTRVDAEEAFSQSLKRFQTTTRSLILDPCIFQNRNLAFFI